jgi:hypothetical protein
MIQEALKKAEGDKGVTVPRPLPQQVERDRRELPAGKAAASAAPVAAGKIVAVSVVILLVVAIALVSYVLWPHAAATARPDAVAAQPVQEVSYRPLPGTAPEVSAGAQAPDAATSKTDYAASAPPLVLNGIMYLEEGPRAIINNAIVETGDSVSGANVVRIDRKKVILVYNDVEITLNLK